LRAVWAAAPRVQGRYLAAASAAFGLAAGSRVSLLPAAALLMALTAVTCWRASPPGGAGPGGPGAGARAARLARLALPAGLPATLIMGLHFAANQLRYGRWSEFGANYQMSVRPLLAWRFVPANLYFYLFHPVNHSCRFPFLSAKWDQAKTVAPAWLP